MSNDINQLNCRVCDSKDMQEVLDFGLSPLANNLLNSLDDKEELFPLKLLKCEHCHNCQLSEIVKPEKMFVNYLYVTSTAKSTRQHFEYAAQKYISMFNLSDKSFVIDIGSNDGTALMPFKQNNIKVLGVDPAQNVCEIANKNGIKTLNGFFNDDMALEISLSNQKADLITASNVFAHSDTLKNITKNVFKLLKDDGVFIVEVQYLLNTLKDMTFDNIYHEHVNYWSLTSLDYFFKLLGFRIFKSETLNTHGGSLRVYVDNNVREVDYSVFSMLDIESENGLTKFDAYQEFSDGVKTRKRNVLNNIKNLSKITTLVGYGAPAKATTLLNYYGITRDYIEFVIEDNKLKHNKFIPKVKIPIYDKSALKEQNKIIIVFAWNYYEEIIKHNQDLISKGIKFINIKDLENENFNCHSNI